HHARVVVEQGVIAVEGAHVLGQGIEQPPERRPALAVGGVGVGGGNYIGPGRVHLGVDDEGGGVDGPVAAHHVALVVDEQQVGHADVAEVHGEGVDPEVVGQL